MASYPTEFHARPTCGYGPLGFRAMSIWACAYMLTTASMHIMKTIYRVCKASNGDLVSAFRADSAEDAILRCARMLGYTFAMMATEAKNQDSHL